MDAAARLAEQLYGNQTWPVYLPEEWPRVGNMVLDEETGHEERVTVIVRGELNDHTLDAVEKWVRQSREDMMIKRICKAVEEPCLTQTDAPKNISDEGLTWDDYEHRFMPMSR